MRHLLFSQDQKMSDLIHDNYKLLQVLRRFNIKLGFENKTIKEVCGEYGVSLSLFLLICNVYTYNNYFPKIYEEFTFDLEDLTDYLINSHKYYIDEQIPLIKQQLSQLANCYDKREGDILKRFFDDYSAEVKHHLSYEEDTVFPYIRSLKEGVLGGGKFTILQFEENHSNIEDKLHDLKNIIIKYLPDQCHSDLRKDILYNLFWLEEDLNKHALFENKILVPYVQSIEKRCRAGEEIDSQS